MANVVYRTEIRPENRASMRKDGAQSASSSWIMVREAPHELVGYAGLCASRVWLTSRLQMQFPGPDTIHCPLSIVNHPPSTIHRPLSTVHCPLSTVHCPLSTIHCPLSTIHSCSLKILHHLNQMFHAGQFHRVVYAGAESTYGPVSFDPNDTGIFTSRQEFIGTGGFMEEEANVHFGPILDLRS